MEVGRVGAKIISRQLIRPNIFGERLPAAVLTFSSLRDAVSWQDRAVPKAITRTMPDDRKKLRGTVARREPARYLLRDSERRLRLVTDNGSVAIAQCDRQARFKFVNRHYAERLGLTPEQVIGKPIPEVIGDKV
jgi:PAS domain-containing protein